MLWCLSTRVLARRPRLFGRDRRQSRAGVCGTGCPVFKWGMSKSRGEEVWKKMDKMSGEFFCLTYGSIVTQLINDYEDVDEVNKQLEKMGYNIGLRLVEEYLAKSGNDGSAAREKDLKELADTIAKEGFKMFLGVSANVTKWNSDSTEFSLELSNNPFNTFVELPEEYSDLYFSNILCGVIRGALQMVQVKVSCTFTKCELHGTDTSEIRVKLESWLE